MPCLIDLELNDGVANCGFGSHVPAENEKTPHARSPGPDSRTQQFIHGGFVEAG